MEKYLCGITFSPFSGRGSLRGEKARESLRQMKTRTGANFVVLAPNARQENAFSEKMDFQCSRNVDDDELCAMIEYAHELGLMVALKPTVNCDDGTWRAHISFFDVDVPCEPKWGNWFASHTQFHTHYAKIARKMGVEMYITGCEMVQTEHREKEWRQLIADVRREYKGLVSYNTDKYQEEHVVWWDALDVISSSGYYPINDWENQLDRIEQVVKKYNKPFFFAEAGCMSVKDSNRVPNDWNVKGEADVNGQADWYRTMFEACRKRDWVRGWAMWSWGSRLYPESEAILRKDYEIYAKPAEKVILEQYKQLS